MGASGKDQSEWYKAIGGVIGGFVFLIVIPALFFWIGDALYHNLLVPYAETIRGLVGWIAIIVGLYLLGWTAYSQAVIGRGTPNPMVPTRKLVITGPFRWCRNPIQLGAMVYYFGLGTVLSSVWVGALMFALVLILGSLFHKYFEEKELAQRFGRDYEDYKARTPFLFPKLW